MSGVYSVQLGYSTGGEELSLTVAAGTVVIVRGIEAVGFGPSDDVIEVGVGAGREQLLAVVPVTPVGSGQLWSGSWAGRMVFEAGQTVNFTSQTGTSNFIVSGYTLNA